MVRHLLPLGIDLLVSISLVFLNTLRTSGSQTKLNTNVFKLFQAEDFAERTMMTNPVGDPPADTSMVEVQKPVLSVTKSELVSVNRIFATSVRKITLVAADGTSLREHKHKTYLHKTQHKISRHITHKHLHKIYQHITHKHKTYLHEI
jgi:hypothetical protein